MNETMEVGNAFEVRWTQVGRRIYRFGDGATGVGVGQAGAQHCVAIGIAPEGSTRGDEVPAGAIVTDVLLVFPTGKQARAVYDALTAPAQP